MQELLWLTLTMNLVASYLAWCIYTLKLYNSLKNPYLYLLFPASLLIPALLILTAQSGRLYLLASVPLTLLLYVPLSRSRKIILVPLPLIIAIILAK